MYGVSAAHVILPTGTRIFLTINNKTISVSINDEVPRIDGTILDLSNDAAFELDLPREGIYPCKIRIKQSEIFTWHYFFKQLYKFLLILLREFKTLLRFDFDYNKKPFKISQEIVIT